MTLVHRPVGIILGLLCASGIAAAELELIVGQKISSTVGFYTTDGEQIASVRVGKHPHEMAFSPDGSRVFVSDNGILWMTEAGEGGNTLSIIDVKQRNRVGVIDLGEYRRPHGIDVDPRTGHLVVTIENPDGLLLVDSANRTVLRKYETHGTDPHMVTLGPDGEWAYVSNTGSATIAAVRLDTAEVTLIPTDARPQGGVFSHDGKTLYITNSDGNTISIIDPEKKERVGTITTGKGPGRIELTPDGKQLVYNLQQDNTVAFADVESLKQTTVISLEGPPLSLSLSPDGKLAFSGVQSLDKVYVISVPEKKIVQVIDTPRGSGPDAVLAVSAP